MPTTRTLKTIIAGALLSSGLAFAGGLTSGLTMGTAEAKPGPAPPPPAPPGLINRDNCRQILGNFCPNA